MMKKNIYLMLLGALVFGIWLTGCGGIGLQEPADDYGYAVGDNSGAVATAPADSTHNEASNPAQQRLVIMSGVLTVETYHPEEIVSFITNLAERYRGFVVKSSLTNAVVDGNPVSRGEVIIRIPAERLTDAIAEIKAQDLTIFYEDVSGEDVTADYVDLESRLRNLEDAAEQLRMIMDNSTDTEAVLEVYKELTRVNEEAEIIRGQLSYYEEAAAMSSLSVTVNPIIDKPEPTPTPTPEPWRLGPTFERTSERTKQSFRYWLEDVTSFFIYGLPMFILRAGPWLVAFYFLGRWGWRKFRKIEKETDEDQSE